MPNLQAGSLFLTITFGGMWRCLRVAVACVFAGILWRWDLLFGYKIFALAKTVTP